MKTKITYSRKFSSVNCMVYHTIFSFRATCTCILILTGSPGDGCCLMATIPCTLALLGSGLSSWTCICVGFTRRTTGLDVVWATAHTRPGWFWTSVHWVRAAPGPLLPGGVALLFRGISKTLWVSVREELVVAAKDLPKEKRED